MEKQAQAGLVSEGSCILQDHSPLRAVSRREFGVLSVLSGFTLPFLNNPLRELAQPLAQLSTIFNNAHPLLTKEGIEIICQLTTQRVKYWRSQSDLEEYVNEKRLLTPLEEGKRYDHFIRRFENLRVTSELFDRAFSGKEQEPAFSAVIQDYEKHIREHFLVVYGDTQRLIDKYILEPATRLTFMNRLNELRRDIFDANELEKVIDRLEDKMRNIRYAIEGYIGKDWTYPFNSIIAEIEDGCSPEGVVSNLVDERDIDRDMIESLKNEIRYYEPIARDISRYEQFRPRSSYLSTGRGAEIFGSLKGLAALAGDDSRENVGDEVHFAISQFHLTFLDWHSQRLFPNGDKDSVEEHIATLFSIFCTPGYQSHITNEYGFDRESGLYASDESRIESMMSPDWGVSYHLLDIQRRYQCYQSMRAALSRTWPNMVTQLGSTGVFRDIENTMAECERVLKKFLKEISPDSSVGKNRAQCERSNDVRSLEELFLSADLRAYIEAVRGHKTGIQRNYDSI